MRRYRLALASVAVLAASSFLASAALAAPHFDGHFKAPKFDTNSKIVEGPDHNIWMAIQGEGGEDVARITPSTGAIVPFALEEVVGAHGIAVGPEGRLWVTDNTGVESFDPAHPEEGDTGAEITGISGGPIVAGPNGEMFVAEEKKVFHFLPSDPAGAEAFDEIEELRPNDIDVVGSELVIGDFGKPRVLTMTTGGTVVHEFPIGHVIGGKLEGGSQGVAASPNGAIGFSQQAKEPEQLGVIQPGGTILAPEIGTPGADPFGVAYGSDTAFWTARSGGAQRITQAGESSFVSGISGKFEVRQIASGPGNTLWLTGLEPGNEEFEVFRISGLEPPVTTNPPPPAPRAHATIGKGPKGRVKTRRAKATVKFTFSSATAGARFECALTPKAGKKKGAKAQAKKAAFPRFAPCKSPKTYRLKPGKYKFSVRTGILDSSPATRSFSVVRVRLHKHGVA